jgi:cell wall assembly regulator SMI1
MDALIRQVCDDHFPSRGASAELIAQFERDGQLRLPDDMRLFYAACNGAKLFDKSDSPFAFFPLEQMCHPSEAVWGSMENIPDWTARWIAFCDVRDGNYVAIDLDQRSDGAYNIMDIFHETFGDRAYDRIIARSFSEFLEGALGSSEGNRLFWL